MLQILSDYKSAILGVALILVSFYAAVKISTLMSTIKDMDERYVVAVEDKATAKANHNACNNTVADMSAKAKLKEDEFRRREAEAAKLNSAKLNKANALIAEMSAKSCDAVVDELIKQRKGET